MGFDCPVISDVNLILKFAKLVSVLLHKSNLFNCAKYLFVGIGWGGCHVWFWPRSRHSKDNSPIKISFIKIHWPRNSNYSSDFNNSKGASFKIFLILAAVSVSLCLWCSKWQILDEGLSPVLERLEHNHAGQIAAMLLEVDKTEVYHLTESLDALKRKVAEAMISLNTTGS